MPSALTESLPIVTNTGRSDKYSFNVFLFQKEILLKSAKESQRKTLRGEKQTLGAATAYTAGDFSPINQSELPRSVDKQQPALADILFLLPPVFCWIAYRSVVRPSSLTCFDSKRPSPITFDTRKVQRMVSHFTVSDCLRW